MANSHRTVDARLVVGGADWGADLSSLTTEFALAGQSTVRSHTALGEPPVDAVPTAIGHGITASVFLDTAFVTARQRTVMDVALIFGDSGQAAIGPMLMRTFPLSMPRDDLILAGVVWDPAGEILRADTVAEVTSATPVPTVFAAGSVLWAVQTEGQGGNVRIGSATTAIPSGASMTRISVPAGTSNPTVTPPGNMRGWIISASPPPLARVQ